MSRLLIAALVLLAVAYVYLGQGEDERPLQAQQQALEKAQAVEQTVHDHAARLQKEIDAQSSGDERKP